MLRTLFLLFSVSFLAASIGCDSESTTGGNNDTTSTGDYFPMTTNSYWTYKRVDGSTYTLTVVGDTTFQAKSYRYFSSNDTSVDASDAMFRREGKIIYTLFPSQDLTGFTDAPVLKETAGATWENKITFLFEITFKYTMKAVSARTVEGVTYTNILNAHADISVAGFPGSTSDQYFAKGIGLIETVDSEGEESEVLIDYSVK